MGSSGGFELPTCTQATKHITMGDKEYNWTTDIKGAKECRMDAFYVKSNISPKDDMAHDADYIIDNFTNW